MAKQKAQPNGSGKSEKQSFGEWFAAYRARNAENRPQLGGQIDALTRDAAKQTVGTLNEIMFGRAGDMSEPGTPLNPTQQLVTESLGDRKVNRQTDRVEIEPKAVERTNRPDADPKGVERQEPKLQDQVNFRLVDYGPLTVHELDSPEQESDVQSEIERMRGHSRGIEM